MSIVSDAIHFRLIRKPVFVDGRLIGFARSVAEARALLRSSGHGRLTVPDLNRYMSEGPHAFYCNSRGHE